MVDPKAQRSYIPYAHNHRNRSRVKSVGFKYIFKSLRSLQPLRQRSLKGVTQLDGFGSSSLPHTQIPLSHLEGERGTRLLTRPKLSQSRAVLLGWDGYYGYDNQP